MIVGGALLLDRVANSIFITWRPDEEFQPGAPIGLERVLTRVDVALRPRWPALKANPPPCSPFFFPTASNFPPTMVGAVEGKY
jgi:hypothetical protein